MSFIRFTTSPFSFPMISLPPPSRAGSGLSLMMRRSRLAVNMLRLRTTMEERRGIFWGNTSEIPKQKWDTLWHSGKRLQFANWEMAIEIVDLPMKHGDFPIFSIVLLVYQRVSEVRTVFHNDNWLDIVLSFCKVSNNGIMSTIHHYSMLIDHRNQELLLVISNHY